VPYKKAKKTQKQTGAAAGKVVALKHDAGG
jgi:hypothetical protein